jgi:hypothetical protein
VVLRGFPVVRKSWAPAVVSVCCFAGLAQSAAAAPGSGGAGVPPAPTPPLSVATAPIPVAQLSRDGRTAIAPADAPPAVIEAIAAGNQISGKPYRYGGGHRSFRDRAYDCSGSVSYVLHAGGFLASPLDSSSLMRWGVRGPGSWITVYTSPAHAYAIVAGLRFDTSGPGPSGPRWRVQPRPSRGFVVRHPFGL